MIYNSTILKQNVWKKKDKKKKEKIFKKISEVALTF